MSLFDTIGELLRGPSQAPQVPNTTSPVPATASPVPATAAPVEIDGIPVSYLDRVAMIESSNNPHAKASTSSACGLYQFTDATWASICAQAPQLRLTADGRMDRDQSTRAMCWLANADGSYFRKFLGRDPQDFERYLMHFLGAPRGTQVCMAKADKPLPDVFGPVAYGAVAGANKFLQGWTAGQLQDWSRKKFSA